MRVGSSDILREGEGGQSHNFKLENLITSQELHTFLHAFVLHVPKPFYVLTLPCFSTTLCQKNCQFKNNLYFCYLPRTRIIFFLFFWVVYLAMSWLLLIAATLVLTSMVTTVSFCSFLFLLLFHLTWR